MAAGGAVKYQAFTNKPLKSATINGNAATLNYAENFTGNATLSSGNNSTTASGTDGSNKTVTQTLQVSTKGPSSTSVTYDSNGNMISDGTNSYAWDAENRLVKITYPGSGNNSQFTYDGQGDWVDIVETSSGSVTSTKQLVWCGSQLREARNASSVVIGKYFPLGETISGTSYFYTEDHLRSVRELTDGSGDVWAQYGYDSYGQPIIIQNSVASDVQYAGYYFHSASGLNITLNRFYNARVGRWLNRDLIFEGGGVNLFAYVSNSPIISTDPSGLGRNYNGLPCDELAQMIADTIQELEDRRDDMDKNKMNLPPDDTHCQAYKEKQQRLRKLLEAYKPCQGPLNGDPKPLLDGPIPQPNQDPNRDKGLPFAEPLPLPGLPELLWWVWTRWPRVVLVP